MQDGKSTNSVATEPFLGHIEYQKKFARVQLRLTRSEELEFNWLAEKARLSDQERIPKPILYTGWINKTLKINMCMMLIVLTLRD